MKNLDLHLRSIENKDWATLLFLLCFAVVVIAKTFFDSRFHDYMRLLFSNKYIKIYKDSSHMLSIFNVLLFFVNLVSLSFFIQITLEHFGYGNRHDWVLFIRIFTLLAVFILSKYLFEKIIAVVFNIEEVLEQFSAAKVSYRTYLGLLLLPFVIVIYFNDFEINSLILTLIAIILIINAVTYLLSLRNYQKFVAGYMFYFILYLCALEITPYYFIYYLVTKK